MKCGHLTWNWHVSLIPFGSCRLAVWCAVFHCRICYVILHFGFITLWLVKGIANVFGFCNCRWLTRWISSREPDALSLPWHSASTSNCVCSLELQWQTKTLPTFISVIMCWGEEGGFPPNPGGQPREPRGVASRAKHQPVLPKAVGSQDIHRPRMRARSLVLVAGLDFVVRNCQLMSHNPSCKICYSIFTTLGSVPKYPVCLIQNFTPGKSNPLIYKI